MRDLGERQFKYLRRLTLFVDQRETHRPYCHDSPLPAAHFGECNREIPPAPTRGKFSSTTHARFVLANSPHNIRRRFEPFRLTFLKSIFAIQTTLIPCALITSFLLTRLVLKISIELIPHLTQSVVKLRSPRLWQIKKFRMFFDLFRGNLLSVKRLTDGVIRHFFFCPRLDRGIARLPWAFLRSSAALAAALSLFLDFVLPTFSVSASVSFSSSFSLASSAVS